MQKERFFIVALCALLMAIVPVTAAEGEEEKEGEVRIGLGLTYQHGIHEVSDFITDPFEDAGYDVSDEIIIPVGLSIFAGYRFAFGGEILADVGPLSLIFLDVDHYYYGSGYGDDYDYSDIDGDYEQWDVPVGLTFGYAFLADKPVSPFLRAGIRHHFTDGDFGSDSTPGPYVAGGVNIFSNSAVQLQLEVGYDGAEVDYDHPIDGEDDEIRPGGFLASIRVAF